MTRFTGFATIASLVLAVAVGCDNRTKTEKMIDAAKEKGGALKEKLSAGLAKIKSVKNQKELVDEANEQKNTIKAKIDELAAKLKEANPELKAKLDKQIAALKDSAGDLEDAIAKAKANPEKAWEDMKAKAIAAMEKAERNMQQQY